jgi:Fe-Mn family superoxide dismutase
MVYEAKNFDNLIGLEGFSDPLLNNHFKLYQGYVTHTNKILELLNKGADTYEYGELKRRFGWEFNGMRLHEYYFENMNKNTEKIDINTPFHKKLCEHFGDYDSWKKDFNATGAMRGIGWVILAYDKEGDKLFNIWINEHDVGLLAGAKPLLVMDVFEHAFVLDYGLDKASYINSFMGAIDWNVVSKRFE